MLNSKIDQATLNKLLNILSNTGAEYIKDKNFGKLLLSLLEVLGQNATNYEQALKHIITEHKSVFKPKLQPAYENIFLESQIFTQTQSFL